ncbi:hypothetical protein OS188_10480 [Xanthomarina sp. F1114]|uniref:hypothetical protein n=1 Tax=Xanthomarina sp. F1114 TaxID=2996019 RepID=UPI00225E1A83|nr:hypothetical protein [Xanthomarina sp. F1114]MCX7548375.1 hypothetical protein [Xanthomarina sp. F1114]
MKRVIVDYKKLTPTLLKLLSDKFPDGYYDGDIITFDNHKNETIEAVEVKTEDCIYLVKVSSKLHYTMTNFDAEDELEVNELGHVIVDALQQADTYKDEEE